MLRLSTHLRGWMSAPFLLLALNHGSAGSMDPLTPGEISTAASLAAPAAPAETYSRRSLATAESASAETPSETTLLIERRQTRKGDNLSRLADVYIYHYDSNELEHAIVDLNTSAVVKTSRSQGTQLPLTQDEIARAGALLFEDDEQFALINNEYRRITGKSLLEPEALNVKAFTFMADNLPQKVNQAAGECGVRRCAQLLIYTDTNYIFEITPIVDLSANVVIQNIGF